MFHGKLGISYTRHQHGCQTMQSGSMAHTNTHNSEAKGCHRLGVLQHIISTLEPIPAESYLALIVRVMDRDGQVPTSPRIITSGVASSFVAAVIRCSAMTRISIHHVRIAIFRTDWIREPSPLPLPLR